MNMLFFFVAFFFSNLAPKRIDHPLSRSAGFNARVTRYFKSPTGVISRDLTKTWGLRVMFVITGQGSRFDSPVPLLTAIGAGVGLLAIATTLVDLIALSLLPSKKLYKQHKVKVIMEGGEEIELVEGEVPPSNKEPLLSNFPGQNQRASQYI